MADSGNNIDKKVKESFSSLDRSAPANLWAGIASDIDDVATVDPIDEKVKSSFEGTAVAAPEHAWDGINRQLNIDLVWNRIAAILDRKPWFYYWRWPAATALLLLLSVGGYFLWKADNSATAAQPNAREVVVEAQISSNKSMAGDQPLVGDVSESANSPIVSEENPDHSDVEQTTIASVIAPDEPQNVTYSTTPKQTTEKQNFQYKFTPNDAVSDDDATYQDVSFTTLEARDGDDESSTYSEVAKLNVPQVALVPISISSGVPGLQEVDSSRFHNERYWSIGALGGYNMTWIYNNATRNSFDPRSLVGTSNTYSATFGVVATFHLDRHNSISGQLMIGNNVSQQYSQYVDGKYREQQLNLRYSSFSMLYRRIWYLGDRFKHNNLVTQTGAFISQLRRADMTVEPNYSIAVSDLYHKLNYGLHGSVGFEKNRGGYTLGYGVQSTYGLRNIFTGTATIPADFNRTNTFQVGGYVSFSFHL